MNLQELINKAPEFTGKNILIIGSPASGKTYAGAILADKLGGSILIHTDDYMQHGFEQSLYRLIDDLQSDNYKLPTIIEGMLGYRLLRKGVELDCYYPDVVIDLQVSDDTIAKTYNEERDPVKLKSVMSMIKASHTVLAKYELMDNKKRPEWITVENNY